MSANMTERLVLGGHRLISCDGYVEDSGEGRWTVEEAIERSVPVPVLMLSPLRPLYAAPGRLVLRESDRRAAPRSRRSRGEERLVAHGQR
jgi:hypothetical protein